MRGRTLFKHGTHASRRGYRALPTAKDEADFRQKLPRLQSELEKIIDPFPVPENALRALMIEILVAMAEARRSSPGRGPGAAKDTASRVTRDDRISQLVALEKIGDNGALLEALRSIDDKTLAAVDAESLALIAEQINKHGKFIDAQGRELHFPASLRIPAFVPQDRPRATLPRGFDGLREELAARGCDMNAPAAVIASIEAMSQASASRALLIEHHPASAPPAYLPMGVIGLRQAISVALKKVAAEKDRAGNREKPYQLDLARACDTFYRAADTRNGGTAWVWGDKKSRLVELAALVFEFAGLKAKSPDHIADIIKKSKRGN